MRTLYGTLTILICLFLSCEQRQKENSEQARPFPRIWSTYKVYESYDEDFKDLKSKGVGAVSVNHASAEAIEAARKHDMKIIMKIEDVTEEAYNIDASEVQRAVMLAGAYKGKAIDRFRFSFDAKPHEIVIENPVYDSINCYGEGLGHYFPGMQDPLKAEVIVKEADFDGSPHLNIIPATTHRLDDHHWQMKFDLTGVSGDLDNVVLAVYWISRGSREYWMFGDSATPFAASTQEAAAEETRKVVNEWAEANGGTFPEDVITIARFGDECWHVSGHLNCSACSYPMWDYSEEAIKAYNKQYPGQVYPRGKAWPDMFGRQSYANWMYNYHEANAKIAGVVNETLSELGIDVPLYRNFTRGQVFSTQNDHDGTGLELLTSKFEITLIDPYPVGPDEYREELIPIDMNYMAGLSRRYGTYLVPWMQAHHYLPEHGYLDHPTANDIERIIAQHKDFQPDAAMWLGYGKGEFYTFPSVNPEAWEKAGEVHMQLFEDQTTIKPAFAAVRPYSVRALREVDERQMQDIDFTGFLAHVSTDTLIHYDPFEPLNLNDTDTESLRQYKVILAAAGNLSASALVDIAGLDTKAIFYIQGADKFDIDTDITGIEGYEGLLTGQLSGTYKSKDVNLKSLDYYQLNESAEVLFEIKGYPVIWKVDNCYFIVGSPEEADDGFYEAWVNLL